MELYFHLNTVQPQLFYNSYVLVIRIKILVLKRVVWKDRFEIIFVGPNQVLLKPFESSEEEITILSEYGAEIDDVKIMGRDNYLVARTNSSLIVADIQRRLTSEVS